MDAWYEADTRAHLGTCMCYCPPFSPTRIRLEGQFLTHV